MDAHLAGFAAMNVIEIETMKIRIHFQTRPSPGGFFHDDVEIESDLVFHFHGAASQADRLDPEAGRPILWAQPLGPISSLAKTASQGSSIDC